jgi:transposase InsO family protein
MRLTPEKRRLIAEAVDRGNNKCSVARVLGVSRTTVYKWIKRRKHLKDRKRKPRRSKVTIDVELAILALRKFCEWGSARIQQGLMSLPTFVKRSVGVVVQGVCLSRTTINNVLKKHGINGYKKKSEGWKFFRAKRPNELWQLDLKGPFTLQGQKYWFVICIDDYSRYLLVFAYFAHDPTTQEVFKLLKLLIKKHKPKKILTDNGNQFKETWKELCNEYGLEAIFAHPYYPQDKGKVERSIRNVSEEFIYLLKKFPEWLNKMSEYVRWHNTERYHRGINATPQQLYT